MVAVLVDNFDRDDETSLVLFNNVGDRVDSTILPLMAVSILSRANPPLPRFDWDELNAYAKLSRILQSAK